MQITHVQIACYSNNIMGKQAVGHGTIQNGRNHTTMNPPFISLQQPPTGEISFHTTAGQCSEGESKP